MQLFINFLLIVSFLFSTSAFAIGDDGKFYKGADFIVAQSQLPPFYQPSQRFSLIQSLRNARFFGNHGIWNPEIPVHAQALEPAGAPQSYTDSLLQLLFPSPDGVNLTANQASSDLVGQLGIEKIPQLIKLSSQPQLVESDILNCLFPDAKIDDDIRRSYQGFLRYEFLRQVFQKLGETGDEIFSTYEIDPKDSQKYSKIFDKVFSEYKKQDLIKESEIEDYALANRISQLISLKKPSRTQSQELEELKKKFPQFFYFETHRVDFVTFRFVDTFLKAKQESSYLFENPIEKALLGYMWLKFKTPEERGKFYKLMGTDDLTDIFKAEGYDFTDYQKIKTQPLDTLDAERVALIKHGYDFFENPFPVTIPYGNATIKIVNKDATYADCVEASLLSLLLYKARQLKEGYYQIVANVFPESSPLRGFFNRYTISEQLFSQEAHNYFAQILAGLKNVKYLKPSGNAPKTYEVKPGLINSLHVFGELIPELGSFLQLSVKSSFQEISESMNILCSYLFSNDASWTWSGIDEEDNLFEKGDIYESIIFSRDQEAILHWKHDLQHTSLECLASNARRFSKEEAEFLGQSSLLYNFLDLMDLVESDDEVDELSDAVAQVDGLSDPDDEVDELFDTDAQAEGLSDAVAQVDGLSDPDAQAEGLSDAVAQVDGLSDIILSTDYRSAEAKIHGVNNIFTLNLENLKPLGFSLIRELVDAEDDDANTLIASQFSSMVRNKSLRDPDARKILKENPELLGESILIDDKKYTYDFVVNALLETNHQDWLIEVAPECFRLSINGNQTETLKVLLPHFSSLLHLELHLDDLSGLKAILDKNIFETQNLIMSLCVKIFNPNLPWFEGWLNKQKKKVYIDPYSFADSNPESITNQLSKLFMICPKIEIRSHGLKEEDQEIVRKALPSLISQEEEDEDEGFL